jgi:hypothetical protein
MAARQGSATAELTVPAGSRSEYTAHVSKSTQMEREPAPGRPGCVEASFKPVRNRTPDRMGLLRPGFVDIGVIRRPTS